MLLTRVNVLSELNAVDASSRFRQAVVPGSHRFATQPRMTLARSYGGGATVGALSHYAMPNHIECSVDAGSAVLFDSSIWHTSMP